MMNHHQIGQRIQVNNPPDPFRGILQQIQRVKHGCRHMSTIAAIVTSGDITQISVTGGKEQSHTNKQKKLQSQHGNAISVQNALPGKMRNSRNITVPIVRFTGLDRVIYTGNTFAGKRTCFIKWALSTMQVVERTSDS